MKKSNKPKRPKTSKPLLSWKEICPEIIEEDGKLTKFTITISDSYCTYAYPFELSENLSIADIARGIAAYHKSEMPKPIRLEAPIEVSDNALSLLEKKILA
jgi:hypothetical protein